MTSLISNTNNTTPKKSKRSRTKSKSIKKRWYEPTWYTIHSKQDEHHQQQQKQQQQQQHHQNTHTHTRLTVMFNLNVGTDCLTSFDRQTALT